jgi:membrane protease YdiL (CAAX protease family)
VIEPTLADWAFIAVLAVAMPLVSALYTVPKLRALPANVQHAIRPRVYGQVMVSQWLFAACALHVVLLRDYAWGDIGLGQPDWTKFVRGLLLVLAIGVAVFYMRRKLMKQKDGAEQVREALQSVQWVLPRGLYQRRLWWAVSAHAGWGEELFYRGFLFALLSSMMPIAAAAVVSTVMFGLAHVYQGVRGIVLTGILGGVFMGLYLVSGSLVVPMLAHALYDIHAGELGYWAFAGDEESKRDPNDQ